MDFINVKAAQRPFPPITRLHIALFLIGLPSAGVLYLVVGPERVSALWSALWLLAQVVWRLLPPLVWAAAGATAVFWLWLMRRLWAGNPVVRPEEGESGRAAGFFF